MPVFGGRLRAERERLGLGQQELAEKCGVTMRSQRNYEKGLREPDAAYLSAFNAVGGDVLYVLSSQRSISVTDQSYVSTSRHMTETSSSVTNFSAVPLIDADRLARIVDLLDAYALQAGRRWPAKRLVAVAAEVYNVLADEPALDETKVERILKLVVNR